MTDVFKRWPPMVWAGLAALALVVPLLLNGGPLYYFDTGGYIEQGASLLKTLGVSIPQPDATGEAGVGEDDGTVIGSRAAVYSAFLIAFQVTAGLTALAITQMGLFALTTWLAARGLVRMTGRSTTTLSTSLALLAGGVTALPFVAGYLMPDIFAPILLISVAALTVLWPHLRAWEIILLLGLGAFATVTHPSHMLIAVLLVPAALLATLLIRGFKGWWLAPLLIALIVGAAAAERVVFTTAAKSVKKAEVVYQPFLTARAVADGPGYDYLAERCPDEAIAACALYDQLQVSDNPDRFFAPNIMFDNSQDLGSFELLPRDTQAAIAGQQTKFFLSVALSRPIDMGRAILTNVLDQMTRTGLWLHVPTPRILEQVQNMTSYAPASLAEARLLGSRDWIPTINRIHAAFYIAAAAAILVMFVWPAFRPSWEVRVFVLMLVAGILANALVCGGISEPSGRYGARVIFLLPMAAVWMALLRGRPRAEA